jgi:hypothetical protein
MPSVVVNVAEMSAVGLSHQRQNLEHFADSAVLFDL